jgi:hypothetical protein
MLELKLHFFSGFFHSFINLTCLDALYADADPFWGSINDSADSLQIRKEPALVYTGYLLSDAAFFLGKAPAAYSSAGHRPFTAYFAYFRHFSLLRFRRR